MHAISMTKPGGADVLAWTEVPDIAPRADEILIDVAAAGVNRADLLQRTGGYPPPPGASEILGLECSGVVTAVGIDVTRVAVGDKVCALLAGGGYAEQVTVPASLTLPVPQGVSLIDAAGLPEVTATVWSNMVMTAGLQAGQRVLIHGGSSGIGTMAIQICRSLGCRVAVTASSPDKLALCHELGADILINYATEDFADRIREATGDHGVDVVLDVVGGDYLARNISALADGGRIVTIGLLGGARAEVNLAALMAKRAGIIGTQLRSRPVTGSGSKTEIVDQLREHLWPLINRGEIRPIVGKTFPIQQAPQAHRALHAGQTMGKVVLTV